MAVGLWAVALEPAQQRESGARRSHSAGGSWGSYEPSLAGFEASKLNSKLNIMLNSKSGLGGSWEELAGSSCARCSGAIRFAHAPARRVKM